MDDLGLVVFSNGDAIPFGKMVYVNEPDYFDAPGHEEAFMKEILPSFAFKQDGLVYNAEEGFYNNAVSLSKQGLMIILNNKAERSDPNEILGYLPTELTSEQSDAVKGIIDSKKFDHFSQNLYEFISDDEPIKYGNLQQYYTSKIGKKM